MFFSLLRKFLCALNLNCEPGGGVHQQCARIQGDSPPCNQWHHRRYERACRSWPLRCLLRFVFLVFLICSCPAGSLRIVEYREAIKQFKLLQDQVSIFLRVRPYVAQSYFASHVLQHVLHAASDCIAFCMMMTFVGFVLVPFQLSCLCVSRRSL
jgi:hypothetical protein